MRTSGMTSRSAPVHIAGLDFGGDRSGFSFVITAALEIVYLALALHVIRAQHRMGQQVRGRVRRAAADACGAGERLRDGGDVWVTEKASRRGLFIH